MRGILTLRHLALALIAFILATAAARGAQDPPTAPTVTLLGKLNPRPPSPYFNGTSGWFYSAVAGYAAGGREYAIIQTGGIGVSGSGVSIIDVTNPASPVEVVYVPLGGDRHEKQVVVHGNYAYACGEEGAGLAIIDLSGLPATAAVVKTLAKYEDAAHTVSVADGVLYLNSAHDDAWTTATFKGARLLDLADPLNPVELSNYRGNECHDTYARGNVMIASGGYDALWDVVDISDRRNPVRVGRTPVQTGAYAHSGYLSEDGKHLFANDEFNNNDVIVFDISNPATPTRVGTFSMAENSIIHYGKVKGNYIYAAHYESGFVLIDIHNPAVPALAGQYRTWAATPAGQYNGAYDVFTGLPSGNVLVSDMKTGLYILKVDVPPRANAGPDQSGIVGSPVALDGSKSDPVGRVSFNWRQTAGTAVTLTGANTASPTFTPPAAGAYTFELTVSDGTRTSAPDSVNVTVFANAPKLAYTNLAAGTGATSNYVLGTRFTTSARIRLTEVVVDGLLNGTANNVGVWAEGNTTPLAMGSVTTGTVLQDVSAPVDIVLSPGTYRIAGAFKKYRSTPLSQLVPAAEISALNGVYKSGTALSYPTTTSSTTVWGHVNFKFILDTNNQPPVLAPVGNRTVAEGSTLAFSLSASDPDGDPLTFSALNLPANASLNAATGAFSFSPDYSQAGTTNVTFAVSDGRGGTDGETIAITVTETNRAPVANAGSDRSVGSGVLVTLDGSGSSDPDGDALAYAWTQISGPSVTLAGANTASPSFTPAQTGSYGFQLVVNDGKVNSAADAVTISVVAGAALPFVEDFESGTLAPTWESTGTGSFRNQITMANGPHGGTRHFTMDSSVSGANSRNELTLTLDLEGQTGVVLRFWAREWSDEAHGPPASPFTGGANFDGVAISSDGTSWYEVHSLRSLTSVYALQTVDLDAAIAARGLAYTRTFRIRFNHYDNYPIATDGMGIDDVSIASSGNRPPVLNPIGALTVAENATLSVTLTASDPDGDAVTFSASGLPAGAALDSATGAFTWTPVAGQAGSYLVTFVASDGRGGTDSEAVTITVTPGQSTLAYTGLSTGTSVTQSWVLGTRFSVTRRIRVKEIIVDGRLNGTANNVGLYRDGATAPIATFSIVTASTMQTLSVPADVALDPGTYRLAAAFRQYRVTYLSALSVAPDIQVSAGVYVSATSLAYPTYANTTRIYGHVNFRYVVDSGAANRAPTLNPVPNQAVRAGQTLAFQLTASDPDGDVLAFTASGLPPGAALNASTGAFAWTPTAAQVGSYTVFFTVSDGRGGSDSKSATITVQP